MVIYAGSCGQTFINMPLNVTYQSTPNFELECQPVNSSILETIEIGYNTWC